MRALLALLSVALLTGAVFGKKFTELEIGMPRDEVVELLGRPDGVMSHGDSEALTYADRLMSGFKNTRADYGVILTNGLVTAFGPGEIRPSESGMLVLIPLHVDP